jgi:hypothetical protein
MKKLLLTAAGTLLTVAAFAQGTVNFANASNIAGWNPVVDRNVRFGATAALYNPLLTAGANVSSNYAGVDLTFLRAALYFAPGAVTDVGLFSQSAGGAATFRSSTSAIAGSWLGGTRTLTGINAQGGLASLFVVVWDSRTGADPLSAAAQASLWGSSAIFQYTTPASPTPAPADFLPNALTGFNIGIVPEPSSFALAGLGAAALLIFRRRK